MHTMSQGLHSGRGSFARSLAAMIVEMGFKRDHIKLLRRRPENGNSLAACFARHIGADLDSILRILGRDIPRHPSLAALKRAVKDLEESEGAVDEAIGADMTELDDNNEHDSDDDSADTGVATDDEGIDVAADVAGWVFFFFFFCVFFFFFFFFVFSTKKRCIFFCK
jgi:hypothetical protein